MLAFRLVKFGIGLFISFLVIAWTIGGGMTGVYLQHNPDKAAAVALGSMSVDQEAGFMDQVSQFIWGAQQADAAMQVAAEAELSSAERAADYRDQVERENYGQPMDDTGGDAAAPAEY